jgi:AcrR family transcriptional regulator
MTPPPKQDRKSEILAAAGRCFARYGFEKTTIDDIGRSVGLNKASLYYYYKNKEAIFTAVIFREREVYLKYLQERVRREKDICSKIMAYMVGRYRFVLDYLNLQNLSSESLNRVKPFFCDLYQSVIDRETDYVMNLILQGIRDKQLKSCDAARVAANLIILCDAIKQGQCDRNDLQTEKGYDNQRVEDDIAFACNLILDGLVR